MNRQIRIFTVLIGLVLCPLGRSQNLFLNWSQLAATYPSSTQGGGFIKLNRTVHVVRGTTATTVVCQNVDGTTAWTYNLPVVGNLNSILTTTDNFIYMTIRKNDGNSYLIAINQDGGYLWSFDFTIGKAPNRLLGEMRIFGSYLLVSGRGRIGGTATDPRTILFSFNRVTGVMSYMREILIGGINIYDNQMLRSGGAYAYLMANRNSSTGVAKIDPLTGDQVGYYAASPFYGRDFQVDSAGGIYITGYTSYGMVGFQPETRKINGAGTGAFPFVYRTLVGGEQLLLSAGSPYLREVTSTSRGLRKLRGSDGALVWYRSIPTTDSIDALRADAGGHIYMLRNFGDTGTGPSWSINTVNPANGADLDVHVVGASDPGTVSTIGRSLTINSYGEALAMGSVYEPQAGGNHDRGVAARLYQTLQAVDDTYTVIQGQTLSTNGNGVLANDKYTNPAVSFVAKVTNSGPSQGTLNLQSNGEFTYQARSNSSVVPVSTQSFRYRVTRDGVSVEGQVTINVIRALSEFYLSRSYTAGSSTVGGTVYLTSAGPAATVTLSDNSPYITTPPSVTVPTNQSNRAFSLSAVEVSVVTPVTVTASYAGVTITRPLQLNPIGLSSMTLSPSTVVGGTDVLVAVTLNATATSPITVNFTSNSVYFPMPPSITFPVGESYAGFYVRSVHPAAQVIATTTASQGGTTITKTLVIKP